MLDLIFSQYSRQTFYEIWQKVNEEKKLEGEEAIIGRMMLEHKCKP